VAADLEIDEQAQVWVVDLNERGQQRVTRGGRLDKDRRSRFQKLSPFFLIKMATCRDGGKTWK
jgi:hypothetical protein